MSTTTGDVASGEPRSRQTLLPGVAQHIRRLAASASALGERHREATARLAAWLLEHRAPGRRLDVVVVCTGNSRRSMLGATMGNAAAAFHGLPDVRCFSAGTTPSAFDPRTIDSLVAVGFGVEPIGDEAPRGEPALANPRYRVRWGTAPGQELVEYSKALGDPSLPRSAFAAVLVCPEAAAGCPVVPGASARIPMPLADPKAADGTPDEAARYAATRDELGRIMIAALAPLATRRAP